MDRIVYTTHNGADSEILFASFDKKEAQKFGGTVQADVINVDDTLRIIKRSKLNRLELFALENAQETSGDTIVYCVVSLGGGIDGRDPTDKGGVVRYATFDRTTRCEEYSSKIEKRVVDLMEVAIAGLEKLNPVEKLILNETYPLSSYRKPTSGDHHDLAEDNWKQEVMNGDTLLGYREWVANKLDASAADPEPSVGGLAPR